MKSVSCFIAGVVLTLATTSYFGQDAPAQAAPPDNEELATMYKEDQADRSPKDGKLDWDVVATRDKARLARVREMYKEGVFVTGNDFYHAAMILQHAPRQNDYLLAHELCVLAISKGNKKAIWLAAASEDRYLDHGKLPQRFATQYTSADGSKFTLATVDEEVADWHRKMMNCPTLAEAKKREDEINKMYGGGDDKKGSTGGGGGQ
ncbi:MAG: hypothetical protein KF784_03070 [Fimbriimonadaceae bacterium]|nr:hypothetical protein [Fimbriimonadaceae bacterium]